MFERLLSHNPGVAGLVHPVSSPILAFLLVFGCGSPPEVPDRRGEVRETVVDGVREVTLGGFWDLGWPSLRLESVDTLLSPLARKPAIGRLAFAQLGGGGGVAVADAMSQEVWIRQEPGKAWVQIAREGEGPSELGFVGGLWWEDQVVSVFDSRNNRLVRFTDAGEHLETTLPFGCHSRTETRTGLGEIPPSVLVVCSSIPDMLVESDAQRPLQHLVSFPLLDGGVGQPDTLVTQPGRAWFVSGTLMGPVPFGPDSFMDLSGGTVVFGDASVSEIGMIRLGRGGRVRFMWAESVESTQERRSGFLRRSLSRIAQNDRPATRRILEELPIPETLPQIGAVLAFDTGFWVSEWFETEIEGQDQLRPETNWRVVGMRPSGIEVSRLALPAGVFPIQVLSDRRALVRLEDISGLHGLGIATLRRAPDG